MRIVDVKVTVVELSGTESVLEIVPVPDRHRLRFTHPQSRQVIEAVAPLPEEFVRTLAALRKYRALD